MSDWTLAIDYGTSFTAAAVKDVGRAEVLEVEDSRRFPSAVVLADDGSLLTGRVAVNQARRSPDRSERSPKRLLGQPAALLGGAPVEVVDMVAAVLRRFGEAAHTRQGGSAPARVLMTHPAGWGPERQDVLREAARRAGLGEVELLTEPEAAAWFFVEDQRGDEPSVEPGRCVAVYDLGGGTFDTAILRRSDEGFSLAGPPGGLDWFGGEDFDERLLDRVLGHVYELDVDTWRQLKEPQSAGWKRARLQLREDVRQAKEALSTMARVSVPVSKGDEVLDVEITRAEFEDLIRADLRRTVDILDKTARDAGVSQGEIAAVYLTGGSSRVPLAAALASEFHPNTYTRPDPKTLVAQGALAKPVAEPLAPQADSVALTGVTREPSSVPGAPSPDDVLGEDAEPARTASPGVSRPMARVPRRRTPPPAGKTTETVPRRLRRRSLVVPITGVTALGLAVLLAIALVGSNEAASGYNSPEHRAALAALIPSRISSDTCRPIDKPALPFPGDAIAGVEAGLNCRQDDVVYLSFNQGTTLRRAYNGAVAELKAPEPCPGFAQGSWRRGKMACGRDPQTGDLSLIWTEDGRLPLLAVFSPLADSLADLVPGWKARRSRSRA